MVGLLGRWPEPSPLEARVEERVDLGDVVRERVTYAVEPGERVPAYLFVPRGLRPGGAPRRRVRAPSARRAVPPGQERGRRTGRQSGAGVRAGAGAPGLRRARARRALLRGARPAQGPPRHAAGAAPGRDFERFEFTRRVLHGSCLQTKMVWDMQRGLDYLESRPEVDPARLGCIGHSLGGQQTLFLAALDERVRAAVSSCGFASMRRCSARASTTTSAPTCRVARARRRWRPPGAEVAPRAFLALNGADRPHLPHRRPARFVRRRAPRRTPPPAAPSASIWASTRAATASPTRCGSRAYAWLDRWLSA